MSAPVNVMGRLNLHCANALDAYNRAAKNPRRQANAIVLHSALEKEQAVRAAVGNLIAAARQEHGGEHHHPECPTCAALANIGATA